MPRLREPPRLYFRERNNGHKVPRWVILDGGKEFCTMTGDREKAEKVLGTYLSSPKHFRTKQVKRRGRLRLEDSVWLYFIEMQAADRPIKIGVAGDVRARIWNLRVSSPFELALLASVQVLRAVEDDLHSRLAPALIRGEWYRRTADVEAALEAAKSGQLYGFLERLEQAA